MPIFGGMGIGDGGDHVVSGEKRQIVVGLPGGDGLAHVVEHVGAGEVAEDAEAGAGGAAVVGEEANFVEIALGLAGGEGEFGIAEGDDGGGGRGDCSGGRNLCWCGGWRRGCGSGW